MGDENSKEVSDESKFSASSKKIETFMKWMEEYKNSFIIYKSDLTYKITLARSQHLRYKILKQMFICAYPMLKKPNRKLLKEELDKIMVGWKPGIGGGGKPILVHSKTHVSSTYIEMFVPEIDDQLDDFLMDLQEKLQEDGKYFTSTKSYGDIH